MKASARESSPIQRARHKLKKILSEQKKKFTASALKIRSAKIQIWIESQGKERKEINSYSLYRGVNRIPEYVKRLRQNIQKKLCSLKGRVSEVKKD